MRGCLAKVPAPLPKKTKIMNYIFIGYALNSRAYNFLIHKSEILSIRVNMIIASRDNVFFEDVFAYKQKETRLLGKKTNETSFRDEGPSE